MSQMIPDPILTLAKVCRSFGETSVLSDVSFEVQDGECVAIVGPSGCGKSTLLRLIAGLDTPTAGCTSRRTPDVQMVFQEAALLPWRTLRENVELPGELSGSPISQDDIAAILASVNLSDHEDKYPHELSGGMKMRASLARAFVTNSDLYLFDEPFSAVDEITRDSLQDLFLSLRDQQRFSCVFVTHNIAEAVYLADKVLVMSEASRSKTTRLSVIEVPLGTDRHGALRFTSDFTNLCQRVYEELRVNTQ
jgi:NitT/TauT family transport system ATP-binding protein